MPLYDCHVHTDRSFDGKATILQQCENAILLNRKAITVTDHNFPVPPCFQVYENILDTARLAREMDGKYEGKLRVFAGVELADQFVAEYDVAPYYRMDLDFVLGSIHSTPIFCRFLKDAPYTGDLKKTAAIADMDFLRRFTEIYYIQLLKTAEQADIDALAHLTFPWRYVEGQAKRDLPKTEFLPLLDEIFKVLIKRSICLEVNTSGFATDWNTTMPDEVLLKRYFALGGRLVTLGSDAHCAKNLKNGMEEAAQLLKAIGFTHASYYEKRKRKEYAL